MELPVDYRVLHWTVRREVRNEYVRIQKGLCPHCGSPLNEDPSDKIQNTPVNKRLFPKNFFKWPVHLHHNHDTGMTIGAVHARCNAVLWEYHGE